MVSKLGPFADNVPIVRQDGTPTPEFVRQLETLLAEKAVTDALATDAVPQGRLINTTSPITGGGDLTTDLTIALDSSTLNESIQDMLNTFLVAGSNITLTYNDGANTLTIASSGGGSGAMSLIQSQTLAAAAATVTFSSIPATYKDLYMVVCARDTTAALSNGCTLRFNNDSGANYDQTENHLVGGANSPSANVGGTGIGLGSLPGSTASAGSYAAMTIDIPQYANTSMEKNLIAMITSDANHTTSNYRFYMRAGLWRSTAAINRLDFTCSGTFDVGSTFNLYGRS